MYQRPLSGLFRRLTGRARDHFLHCSVDVVDIQSVRGGPNIKAHCPANTGGPDFGRQRRARFAQFGLFSQRIPDVPGEFIADRRHRWRYTHQFFDASLRMGDERIDSGFLVRMHLVKDSGDSGNLIASASRGLLTYRPPQSISTPALRKGIRTLNAR